MNMNMIIAFLLIFSLLGGAYSRAANAVTIPLRMNLYGPAQADGALRETINPGWNWVGSALTPSTKTLRFGQGYPKIAHARALVIWLAPTTNYYAGIFWFDRFGSAQNMRLLDYKPSEGSQNPRIVSFDLTTILQDISNVGENGVIAFKIWGDGVTQMQLYEVRVEIEFEIE